MAVLVGNLYADKPELKDAGFNIYYMGVNIGATIAPLLATYVSIRYGSYNLSFWICGAGLLIALAILQASHGRLATADIKARASLAAAPDPCPDRPRPPGRTGGASSRWSSSSAASSSSGSRSIRTPSP